MRSCQVVASDGNTPPLLELAPHSLEEVAVLVCAGVARDGVASGDYGRNDGLDPAFGEQASGMVGVVTAIGDEPSERPYGIGQGAAKLTSLFDVASRQLIRVEFGSGPLGED